MMRWLRRSARATTPALPAKTAAERREIEGARPTTHDGRNIHPLLGLLEGEAARQRAGAPTPPRRAPEARGRTFDVAGPAESTATYYDLPAIKEPVWGWAIPTYFYIGGTAGAAGVIGLVAQLSDDGRALRGLVLRARWLQTLAVGASAALLIYDLGRPARFLYMLRVFRPSSPMNVGTWVLTTAGSAGALATAAGAIGGPLATLGDAAGVVAGLASLPLANYTAVLLSNTVVPVWSESQGSLPWLFASGALAGAACVLSLGSLSGRSRRIVDRLAIAGAAGELVFATLVRREARARVRRVAAPLEHGVSGALWRGAKVLTAGSLVLALTGRARRLSAALGIAGGVLLRFGIHRAGYASARDPRATFELQRARQTRRVPAVSASSRSGREPSLQPTA